MARQVEYRLPTYEVAKLRKEEEAVGHLQYRVFVWAVTFSCLNVKV